MLSISRVLVDAMNGGLIRTTEYLRRLEDSYRN